MEDNTEKLLSLQIQSLKEITEEKFKGIAMALVLQAEDYKRRLEGMTAEIERLRKKSDEDGGKKEGTSNVLGFIVGAIGVIGVIISIIINLKGG